MENENTAFENATIFTENIYYESANKFSWEKSKRRVSAVFSLYTIFIIAIIFILIKDGYNPSSLLPICIIVTMYILTIAYYVDIFTFKIIRKYRKEAQNGTASIYKYKFKDQLFTGTWQTGTITVFYNQISRILYTKNTCILVADQNTKIHEFFVVDKHGFSQGTYDDFIDFLKGKMSVV